MRPRVSMVLPLPERGAAMTSPRDARPVWPRLASVTSSVSRATSGPQEIRSEASLRKGRTTGTCAAAAARAAYEALLSGAFPASVSVTFPEGPAELSRSPWRSLARGLPALELSRMRATTRMSPMARWLSRASRTARPDRRCVRAGEGIGTVTRAGLPLPPGTAINPVPRLMIKRRSARRRGCLMNERRDRRNRDSGRRRDRQADA